MSKERAEADFYGKHGGARLGERVTPPKRPTMSGHVPVRFQQSTIERIKAISAEEGVTVSTWIRRVIDEAVRARLTPQTKTRVVSMTLDAPAPLNTVPSGGDAKVSFCYAGGVTSLAD